MFIAWLRKVFVPMNDINNNDRAYFGSVLVSFTAIFSVIAMAVQACAVLFGYDPVMQVYKLDSTIAAVSTAVLSVLSVLASVLSVFAVKRAGIAVKAKDNVVIAVLSAMGGCAMILSSVLLFFENGKASGPLGSFTVALVLFSLPAGLYFILGTQKEDKIAVVLSFFPTGWYAVCLMRLYFDTNAAINDPIRVLLQISFVFIMLALLFELRMRVKGSGGLAFALTSSLSAILGCASAISVFLLYFITKSVSSGEFFVSLASLITCFYLILKLNGYMKAK